MNEQREAAGAEAASATGAVIGMGSAATAAAISACCAGPALGPLVVALFGAGGAVALEGFRPYAVPLLAASGLAVAASIWLTLRSARQCSLERRSSAVRIATRTLVWASCIVWLAAVVAVVWARFA